MATVYQYLTPAEYADLDLSVSGITNSALAERHISLAERLVDAYCRGWRPFYPRLTGTADSGTTSSTLVAGVFGEENPNYWAVGGLYVRVIDGPAAGQERLVTASTGGQVTLASGVSGLAAGAQFTVDQRSVFPRDRDWDFELPFVPEPVKLAVAFQIAYGVRSGSEAFGPWEADVVRGERASVTSETYGSGYSYQRAQGALLTESARLIAPQARMLLRGFVNRTGRLVRHGNWLR